MRDAFWDQKKGYLGSKSYKVNGTSATPAQSGGLRLAAVYSTEFATGPGARVFYHADDDTTAPYVQELIWDQAKDEWTSGAKIADALSSSQLAATVDSTAVRLFYATANGTLRESYQLLKPTRDDQRGVYFRGLDQPGVMADRPGGPISAITTPGNNILVYYTDADSAVHELKINTTNGEKASINPNIAAAPANQSLFGVGAVYTAADQEVRLLFTDVKTGDIGAVSEVKRPLADERWAANQQQTYLALTSEGKDP